MNWRGGVPIMIEAGKEQEKIQNTFRCEASRNRLVKIDISCQSMDKDSERGNKGKKMRRDVKKKSCLMSHYNNCFLWFGHSKTGPI